MSDHIVIDTSDLKKLSTQLRRVSPELQKEFLNALKKSGNRVAVTARALIVPHSSRIGGTIKVKRSGVSVRIVAGGARAPHAAAFEHKGDAGTFRHPVFAKKGTGRSEWTWTTQKAHPFMHPAAAHELDAFVRDVLTAVDLAFEKAGWHG